MGGTPKAALRDGVVAGTAAGTAAENAPGAQVKAFEGTVLFESLQGILRTGRRKTAGGRGERRNAGPVEGDDQQKGGVAHPFQDFFYTHTVSGADSRDGQSCTYPELSARERMRSACDKVRMSASSISA